MANGVAEQVADFGASSTSAARPGAVPAVHDAAGVLRKKPGAPSGPRHKALGEHGLRMLGLGVTGDPGDVAEAGGLAKASTNTIFFPPLRRGRPDAIGCFGRHFLPT